VEFTIFQKLKLPSEKFSGPEEVVNEPICYKGKFRPDLQKPSKNTVFSGFFRILGPRPTVAYRLENRVVQVPCRRIHHFSKIEITVEKVFGS
jgi:hypothetical protein